MMPMPGMIDWDEVIALTTLSSVVMGVFGTVFTLYISSIINAKIDQKFKEHTEDVLKPLINELVEVRKEQARVATELARTDERIRNYMDLTKFGTMSGTVKQGAD